jgi:hypothetical protein
VTRSAAQFIEELDTIHVAGDEDSVSDADGNVYPFQGCECGGTFSFAGHRAELVERYVQERIAAVAGNNHTEVLTRVVAQLAG